MDPTINSAYENPYSALIRDYNASKYANINKYMESMDNPVSANGLAVKLAGPRVTEVVEPVAPKVTEVVKPTAGNFLGMDDTKKMFGSINKLDDANSAQKDYMAQASTIGSEYTSNPEIQSALLQGYNSLATPAMNDSLLGMSGSTIGNIGGLADTAGGLYGMYSKYQQNKRADDIMDMYNQDRNIAQKKERDFSGAVSKSGLGTYVTGQ